MLTWMANPALELTADIENPALKEWAAVNRALFWGLAVKRRFTGRSRTGRGSIPKSIREGIYSRDEYICQYCLQEIDPEELTIDHLVPLAHGGLDEVTNYVTCCRTCNGMKADRPLEEFADTVGVKVVDLPVHGDPIIDNEELPIEIRVIRKRIFDRARLGSLSFSGRSAQKKIEKAYRAEFWASPLGQELEAEEPGLPGRVRIVIPEIKTIAASAREYLLLVELAKSANTRDLIGTVLNADVDIESRVRSIADKSRDAPLAKRLKQALRRFERAVKQKPAY